MNLSLRFAFIAAILLTTAVLPGLGQNTGKIVPKLEPVAETRLLMEAIAHANFRGLERNLTKKPMDDQAWVFARGQSLLIAETANLLMLRPPKNSGETAWMERSMDLRNQALQLAQHLAKKDMERSKAGMQQLANSCNRCHQTFKTPIEIVPFQQPEPPPVRKVSADDRTTGGTGITGSIGENWIDLRVQGKIVIETPRISFVIFSH